MRPALALVLALAACGPRAVLGHGGRAASPAAPTQDAPPGAPAATGSTPPAGDPASSAADADIRVVSAADGLTANGVVLSRLPAPHRFREPTPFTPPDPVAARALVGHRDPRPHLAFALDVAAAFTGAAAPDVADGEALARWAQERGQWISLVPGVAPSDGALAPGDLVVFDRADGGRPASLAAVVLGTDARGVTDLLYVGRGVVRRGFLDVARPTTARDREGRVVNSFVRHGADHPPPGTRYLAGELAAGRVRLR